MASTAAISAAVRPRLLAMSGENLRRNHLPLLQYLVGSYLLGNKLGFLVLTQYHYRSNMKEVK